MIKIYETIGCSLVCSLFPHKEIFCSVTFLPSTFFDEMNFGNNFLWHQVGKVWVSKTSRLANVKVVVFLCASSPLIKNNYVRLYDVH